MANNGDSLVKCQLFLPLIILGALVVIVYHFIKVTFCNQARRPGPTHQPTIIPEREDAPSRQRNLTVELVPAHKFENIGGLEENVRCACVILRRAIKFIPCSSACTLFMHFALICGSLRTPLAPFVVPMLCLHCIQRGVYRKAIQRRCLWHVVLE